MTSDHTTTGARNLAPPPAAAAPPPQPTGSRRFSAGVVIGAALVGLVLGAIATFAVTGFVWTVRVELPLAAISATAVADSAARLRFTAIAWAGTCAGRNTRAAAAAGTARTSAACRATAAGAA